MPRFSRIIALAGAFLLSSGAYKAAVAAPERQWTVLETPHFSVHFLPAEAASAERIGAAAEEVLPKILADLGASLHGRVPIILDREASFNGSAEPIKDRITLDPLLAKSSVIGTKRFIAHELTHVVSFEALTDGSGGSLGKIAKLSSLSGLPLWFLEGLAQYEAEYWSSSNDRMLRLRTLEGKLLSEGERNNFALLGLYGGAAGYNEGYSLTKYLFDTYGHERLAQLFTALRGDPTLNFPLAIEKVMKKNLSSIEADWRKALVVRYDKMVKGVAVLPAGATRLIQSHEQEVNVSPRLSPDGKKIAFLSSKNQESFLYLRGEVMGMLTLFLADADGKNRWAVPLSQGKIDAFDWSPDGKKLVFNAFVRGNDGQPGYRLISYDLAKKKAETLVEAVEIASPAWRPLSQEVAYIGAEDGKASLILFDTLSLKKRSLPVQGSELRFGHLAWSPDGKKLVASAFLPGDGAKLVAIDPESGKVEPLTSGEATLSDQQPVFSPDGKEVLFASNRDGMGNLYRVRLEDRQLERLTQCYSGLNSPAYGKEGKIIFVAHRALGSEIYAFDGKKGTEILPPAREKVQMSLSSPLGQSKGVVHPYEPKLTNDLIIPQISSDERGQQVGLTSLYSDVLNQRQLGLDLRYGLASQRFSYTASYLDRRADDPWSISLYDRPELALSGKIDPNHFYDALYLGRRQGFSGALSHDLGGGQNLTLGANVAHLSVLLPSHETGVSPHVGREHSVNLNWSDTHIKPSIDLDVNPNDGYQLALASTFSDKRIGSDFNFSQFLLSGDRFLPLGGKQTLAWHFKSGVQFGDNTPFFLGGAQGGNPLFPLRGALAGSASGDRLAYTGVDYTLPLFSNIDRQLGAFYLNKAFLSAFIEGGDAWKGGELFRPRASAGMELKLKAAFMGRQVVVFRLGLAHMFGQDNATRFYLLF